MGFWNLKPKNEKNKLQLPTLMVQSVSQGNHLQLTKSKAFLLGTLAVLPNNLKCSPIVL